MDEKRIQTFSPLTRYDDRVTVSASFTTDFFRDEGMSRLYSDYRLQVALGDMIYEERSLEAFLRIIPKSWGQDINTDITRFKSNLFIEILHNFQ